MEVVRETVRGDAVQRPAGLNDTQEINSVFFLL